MKWWEALDYLGASPAVDGLVLGEWRWVVVLPPCCGDCIYRHPPGECVPRPGNLSAGAPSEPVS